MLVKDVKIITIKYRYSMIPWKERVTIALDCVKCGFDGSKDPFAASSYAEKVCAISGDM